MNFLLFLLLLNVNTEISNISDHDFHLSRCEINYETATGDIQIAAHIFIDDLENALGQTGAKRVYIATSKESADCNTLIEKYINQKLKLKAANRILTPSFLGKESSKDMTAVWCYLEVTNIKNLKEFEIENKILTEIFIDQKNIIDFTVNKKKKHFTIFDSKKTSEIYSIK